MSGNFEDAGYANNPSDLIKQYRKQKLSSDAACSSGIQQRPANADEISGEKNLDRTQLAADMKQEHGFGFRRNILQGIEAEQSIKVCCIFIRLFVYNNYL
jgi:hypothetical protein